MKHAIWVLLAGVIGCAGSGAAPAAPPSAPGVAETPASVAPVAAAPAEPGPGGGQEEPPEAHGDGDSAKGPRPEAKSSGPPADAPTLPRGATVLVIGDSFSQSLAMGLKAVGKEMGVRFLSRGEQATYIPEWAGPKRGVPILLKQDKPDLVLIVLGGNELAMADPTIRAPRVRELVGHMGEVPCVWVAPALWGNRETGLLEVIRTNSHPCRHYDSNRLAGELPRGGDKIHPTPQGQRLWATALLDWLRAERDWSREAFALKPRPDGE